MNSAAMHPQDFPRLQADVLAADLRATITGEVRFDDGTTALYAVDGQFPNPVHLQTL